MDETTTTPTTDDERRYVVFTEKGRLELSQDEFRTFLDQFLNTKEHGTVLTARRIA